MAELEESGELSINVRSFAGTTVLLKVGKKPGMERVELLADETSADTDKKAYDSAPSGLWNTLSKYSVDKGGAIDVQGWWYGVMVRWVCWVMNA